MSAERTHPFPGNELQHVAGMGLDSESQPDPSAETRTVVTDLDAAMVVTSRTTSPVMRHGGEQLHRPVLDVDLPITVVPSTTPGHHHLLIDRAMPWTTYLTLLDALVAAGIVEPGYVAAARARGHTCVRVPWLRKGDPAPALPRHQCMTDPASRIPAVMSMPDPGPVEDGEQATCAVCSTRWVVREVVGFVCWQPADAVPAPAEAAF